MKDTKSFAIELIHLLGIVANDFTVKGVTNKLEDFMKAQELSYTNDVNINLKEIGTLEEREITVAEAVNRLIDEINRDKGLYVAYHANIAMSFKDAYEEYCKEYNGQIGNYNIHTLANEGATRFLENWTANTHKPIIGHTEEELIEIHQAWYKKGYEDAQAEDYNSPSRKLIALQSLIGMEAYNLLDSISKPGFNSEVSIALSTFFKRFPEFPKDAENIPPFPAGGLSPQSDFKLYQQKGKEQEADQIIEDVCCFLDRLKMKVNTKSSSNDTYQAFHDQYTLNDKDIREIVSQVDTLSGYLKRYSKVETNFKLFGGFVQPEIEALQDMLSIANEVISVVFEKQTSKPHKARIQMMREQAALFERKMYNYIRTPKGPTIGRELIEHRSSHQDGIDSVTFGIKNYPYSDSALNEIKRSYTDEQYIEMMSKADNYQKLSELADKIFTDIYHNPSLTPVGGVGDRDIKKLVDTFTDRFNQYKAIGAMMPIGKEDTLDNWKLKYEHLNNELVLFSNKNTELKSQLTKATNLLKRGLNGYKALNKDSSNNGDNTCNVKVVEMWGLLDWSEDVAKHIKAYGIQDTKDMESSEKEAFNKKLPRAHGKTPGFIEFLDLWAHNELKAVSWERFSLSVSPTALNEAYTKAVKAYRLLVEDENKPKNVFVHPKLAQNNAAGKVHTKALQDEGYTNAHSVAYDTNSGLRVLRYTANNLTHLSVTHPDRLPTLQEMQWLRDELCREVKQMAWVIKYSDRPIGENGNYTIALIELIYV